jgi:phage terminase Nu1 subunit (DNA packaging protein)
MFLTARELATTLKVSLATVRAWQREELPHEPAGRLPRYMLETVQGWLRDREARKRRERESRRHQKVA